METILPVYTKLNELENEIRVLKSMIKLHNPKKQFLRAAGSWARLDTESIKKNIYKNRNTSNRPKVEL